MGVYMRRDTRITDFSNGVKAVRTWEPFFHLEILFE